MHHRAYRCRRIFSYERIACAIQLYGLSFDRSSDKHDLFVNSHTEHGPLGYVEAIKKKCPKRKGRKNFDLEKEGEFPPLAGVGAMLEECKPPSRGCSFLPFSLHGRVLLERFIFFFFHFSGN